MFLVIENNNVVFTYVLKKEIFIELRIIKMYKDKGHIICKDFSGTDIVLLVMIYIIVQHVTNLTSNNSIIILVHEVKNPHNLT